ncbi:CPBP family intramembrane metalloprotease [Patescibacteria group bacterium]|nr:CPBP family intramembrane metalloprotease [Patescibacteria group bacterium]
MKKIVNWKIYFILLSASVLSILAIMPYIITIQGEMLKAAPMPFSVAILIIVLQSTLLFAILTFIGLKLSSKLGLRVPIIERFVANKKIDFNVKSIIKISVLLGVLTGIVIVFLDFIFSQFGLESLFKQTFVPIWQGFLASFYGGISEEIVMRLFFMTFVIWLISKITKQRGKIIENNLLVWSSIIIATILFGIGHLPITSALITITPLVIFRALLLNGIGGIVFGWLYWKKGLEPAMIAHFSADIIIHVCLPFISMML